jgi:ABC-type dipeptide/oligopeptide/nickel transport system permease component
VRNAKRKGLPEISIVLHHMPRSVELILETVFSITHISGLTDVTAIEVQFGTFNEHLPP